MMCRRAVYVVSLFNAGRFNTNGNFKVNGSWNQAFAHERIQKVGELVS